MDGFEVVVTKRIVIDKSRDQILQLKVVEDNRTL